LNQAVNEIKPFLNFTAGPAQSIGQIIGAMKSASLINLSGLKPRPFSPLIKLTSLDQCTLDWS